MQRTVIDAHADHHTAAAICLAKAIQTSWGGGVSGSLFVPRTTFDFFNRIEPRQMHRHNPAGDSVWYKSVEVPGVPFVKLHLTTIEAPQ